MKASTLLYGVVKDSKKFKTCKSCGCILGAYYVGGNVCDCCLDDMREEVDK